MGEGGRSFKFIKYQEISFGSNDWLRLRLNIKNFTIDNFLQKQALENQTAILNATVCQREKFIELIEAEIKLQLVEIPHWAGLGGVCYIPPEQRRSLDDQGTLLMGIDIWQNK